MSDLNLWRGRPSRTHMCVRVYMRLRVHRMFLISNVFYMSTTSRRSPAKDDIEWKSKKNINEFRMQNTICRLAPSLFLERKITEKSARSSSHWKQNAFEVFYAHHERTSRWNRKANRKTKSRMKNRIFDQSRIRKRLVFIRKTFHNAISTYTKERKTHSHLLRWHPWRMKSQKQEEYVKLHPSDRSEMKWNGFQLANNLRHGLLSQTNEHQWFDMIFRFIQFHYIVHTFRIAAANRSLCWQRRDEKKKPWYSESIARLPLKSKWEKSNVSLAVKNACPTSTHRVPIFTANKHNSSKSRTWVHITNVSRCSRFAAQHAISQSLHWFSRQFSHESHINRWYSQRT